MSESKAAIAIVTAGARRLGRAIAYRLAELGYDIALHYNTSREDAEETRRELTAATGRRCELFRRDLTDTDEVLALIPEIKERMGTPVVLINNASIYERNTIEDATPEQFELDFAIHVKAPFFLMREFARGLDKGHVINIVDTAITREKTNYFTYLLSKKTLHDLTRMAAVQLAPQVRVNEIAPGAIITPKGADPVAFGKWQLNNPLQYASGPQHILLALDYLLANDAVTGETLFVDSGEHVDV